MACKTLIHPMFETLFCRCTWPLGLLSYEACLFYRYTCELTYLCPRVHDHPAFDGRFYCRYTFARASFHHRQLKYAMKEHILTEGTADDVTVTAEGAAPPARPEMADA